MCIYKNAVANSVIWLLYLWHDLYNIVFKIMHELYIAKWLQNVRKLLWLKQKPHGAGMQTICDLNNDNMQLMKFVRKFEQGAAPSYLEKCDVVILRGGCCHSLVQPKVSRRNVSLWSHVSPENQVASTSFTVILTHPVTNLCSRNAPYNKLKNNRKRMSDSLWWRSVTIWFCHQPYLSTLLMHHIRPVTGF